MLGLFGRRVVAALVGAAIPVLVSAEEPAKAPPTEELVSRAVTPGVLGLLARAGASPAAHEYVRKAVRDANPNTRAAAARMAYVLGVEMARADLRAALEVETSPDAAAEQASALLRLSADDDEAILRFSARVERFPLEQAARRLAFLRPASAVARLPLLAELGLGEPSEREVLEIAILADPRSGEALARSILERGEGYSWGFFLGAHERAGVPPASSLLAQGLGKEKLRTVTLQWMAAGAWYPGPKETEIFEVLAGLGGRVSPFDGFLLEIVRRQGGRRPMPLASTVAADVAAQLGPLLIRPKVRAVLLSAERAQLGAAVYGDPMWLVQQSRWAELVPHSRVESELVAAHPPGFLTSLIEEAGCKPKDADMVAAQTRFDGVGLPQDLVAVIKGPSLSGECGVAAAAALWSHVSALPRTGARSATLVVAVGPDAASCSVEPETKTRDIAEVWGKKAIEATRSKRARPVDGRIPPREVAVAVEVGPNGCVRGATPALGAPPRLVPEALRAVAGWRYARFASDGKPISFRTIAYVSWQ